MSFAIYFAFVNRIISNNEGYKYKKAIKGDYDYDYDSDAETVVYDFEEDAKDKEQELTNEEQDIDFDEQDDDDVETIVCELEELEERELGERELEEREQAEQELGEQGENYFDIDEGKIFACVEYEKYIKTKQENLIDEIINELGYIPEENLKEINDDYINTILKEIENLKIESDEESEEECDEESEEECDNEEEEEHSEEEIYNEEQSEEQSDEDDEEDDGINIIIEDSIWPRVQRAEESLTNYEVNQRGYKLICNKDEMFKRMYKTKKCPKSNCKLYGCPFYHNETDKRIGVCAFERGCVNPNCTLVHL